MITGGKSYEAREIKHWAFRHGSLLLCTSQGGVDAVFWADLCPQNSHAEVLIPSASRSDLIWRWDLYTGNEVKMRSLG